MPFSAIHYVLALFSVINGFQSILDIHQRNIHVNSFVTMRSRGNSNQYQTISYNSLDLSCLDWVDEDILQRFIYEFGLHLANELPELGYLFHYQQNGWDIIRKRTEWQKTNTANYQV